MSLILDALNRADQERSEQNHSLGLFTPPNSGKSHNYPLKRWFLEALIVIAAIVFYLYSQHSNKQGPIPTVTQTPIAVQADSPNTDIQVSTSAVQEPELLPPHLTPTNKKSIESDQSQSSKAIDRLYQKQLQANAATTKINKNKASTTTKPKPEIITPPLPSSSFTNNDDGLSIFRQMPLLSQMPTRFQASVPNIDYSVHIYSEKAGLGFVTLNDRKRKIGDEIAPGLILIQILNDSVVLDYNGRQFRLLSLNSWINYH